MADTNDLSRRSWNETQFNEFYLSGEPETTSNYPLLTYHADVKATYLQDDGEYSLYLQETVTVPGQILIVENTDVSCACIRDCSPNTEASIALLNPPLDRIPQKVHEHLAHKLARVILEMEDAGVFSNDALLQFKSIEHLDARQHPAPDMPANLDGLALASLWEKRGPWNEDGAEKILDFERVWNIIANNAVCFKVRSRSPEQRSQVETCDLWGMWIMPSLINHSCVPNCHAMRVGDAIIIRAARPIEAGTELTLPYFDIFQPLCKRESAAQNWGFRCLCSRCAFECLIGNRYDVIQEQIVNLEKQIQKSSVFKDDEQRRMMTDRLLEKLADQLVPLNALLNELKPKEEHQSQGPEQPFDEHDEFSKLSSDCVCASFSEALIAWYAENLQHYKSTLPQGTEPRTENTWRLVFLNTCLKRILKYLVSVHPGSLLCEEFYSLAIKARNELVDDDVDEKLKKELIPREELVTRANLFSRYYYGPNVNVFQSVNWP